MRSKNLKLSIAVVLFVLIVSLGLHTWWKSSRSGIDVESVRITAGGYMLDFRYKVTDSDKASRLLKQATNPMLIDEASGATFIVPVGPKVGALKTSARNGSIKEGVTGFIIFANPGQFVKRGNLVTVAIGDFKTEHLEVQ